MEKWWQDFRGFRRFITPKLMPFVFWAGVVIAVVMGIITIIEGALFSSARLIFLGIVTLFLGPIFVRVLCEFVMTFFRERE